MTGSGDVKAEVEAEAASEMKDRKKPTGKSVAKATAKPAGKVVKFTPAPKKAAVSQAAEMIPFDDEPRAKVGTTEGF
ncbi:hypothetical protein D3C87_2083500 [compost metagenome]